jgi:hypothetical protein
MPQKLTLLTIAVLFVGLVALRVWQSADLPERRAAVAMPTPLDQVVERELHRTPGGKYTLADVEANGSTLPSERYRGFQSRHDIRPQTGEPLCPVTRTRASPDCTWIIDGRIYQFCCPPCIDELVRLAKERPEELMPPSAYVQP